MFKYWFLLKWDKIYNVRYLPEANKQPLAAPKQEIATNIGMMNAVIPSIRWPQVWDTMKNQRSIKKHPLCKERSNLKKIHTTIMFSAICFFQFIDENCPLEIIYLHFFNKLKKNIHTEFAHDILVFIHDCIFQPNGFFYYLALFSFANMFLVWT